MTHKDLGKIAYEAACRATGCTQPWAEANQEKWIAAGVATYLAGMRASSDIAEARAKKLWDEANEQPADRFLEAIAISELIDKAAALMDNDGYFTTAKSLHEPLRATDGA